MFDGTAPAGHMLELLSFAEKAKHFLIGVFTRFWLAVELQEEASVVDDRGVALLNTQCARWERNLQLRHLLPESRGCHPDEFAISAAHALLSKNDFKNHRAETFIVDRIKDDAFSRVIIEPGDDGGGSEALRFIG